MLVAGAVIASSFVSPAQFVTGSSADAADAVPLPPVRDAKVPEFVPVINYSQFVLAVQTFAAENPPAARLAAEALSAKFTSDQASQSTGPQAEPRTASIIITRPVVVAPVVTGRVADTAEDEPSFPRAPDPTTPPTKALADPVKVATTAVGDKPPATTRRRHKPKTVASNRAKAGQRLQPAMALGMTIESAEDAPPISSLAKKKAGD